MGQFKGVLLIDQEIWWLKIRKVFGKQAGARGASFGESTSRIEGNVKTLVSCRQVSVCLRNPLSFLK